MNHTVPKSVDLIYIYKGFFSLYAVLFDCTVKLTNPIGNSCCYMLSFFLFWALGGATKISKQRKKEGYPNDRKTWS